MFRVQSREYILGFLAFFLPLFLYIKTLSPSYIPIDSAEFTMCMKYWGLCHPPGFPLYVALGHFFTQIFPFGSLIYKANLFSAIFGALTILFVYLGQRSLKVRVPIAFAVAIFFSVNSIFWEYSVAADVFTFATFLIALSMFLNFRGHFLLSVFVLGLSSSHFYITAILLPIYYFFEVSEKTDELKVNFWREFWNFRKIIITGLVFASAFFPQAVMWLRMNADPQVNWGHAKGLSGFYYYLRRQEFGSIFLIANPVLTFHIGKFFKHIIEYFPALFVNFGVILPLAAVAATFLRLFSQKKAIFIFLCFIVVLFIQLFLLSTIDPTGVDNPFQIGKFYLSSFVIIVFLMGLALDLLIQKFFDKDLSVFGILIFILIAIYALSNYRVNNLSSNLFTQNMILDAMDELPQDSIAITVSHIMYFGGRYEQEENGKYKNVTLLYFPNEKNRDNEFYHPEVFARQEDSEFIEKIKKGKTLGKAEEYVLATISKNLDKPIYILQGTFEEGFFAYLKPYIVPHGLWWRVEENLNSPFDAEEKLKLTENWRNKDVKANDFELKVQRQDTVNYAISFFSTGTLLATAGYYDSAISAMEKSLMVKDSKSVKDTIDVLKKVKDLDSKSTEFIKLKNENQLLELGNNLFIIKNYKKCTEVFEQLILIKSSASSYNNLASCYAILGEKDKARTNYQKALELDPNMEMAKSGLENL